MPPPFFGPTNKIGWNPHWESSLQKSESLGCTSLNRIYVQAKAIIGCGSICQDSIHNQNIWKFEVKNPKTWRIMFFLISFQTDLLKNPIPCCVAAASQLSQPSKNRHLLLEASDLCIDLITDFLVPQCFRRWWSEGWRDTCGQPLKTSNGHLKISLAEKGSSRNHKSIRFLLVIPSECLG